jgi:hypothetical protein
MTPSRGCSPVRFNTKVAAFARITAAYRAATAEADRVLRKFLRAERRGDLPRAEALDLKLQACEERIDLARRTLEAHTRATLARPMRTRARPPALPPLFRVGQRSA